MPPKGVKKNSRYARNPADMVSDSLLDQLLADSDSDDDVPRPARRRGFLSSAKTKKEPKRPPKATRTTSDSVASAKPKPATQKAGRANSTSKSFAPMQFERLERPGKPFGKPMGVPQESDELGLELDLGKPLGQPLAMDVGRSGFDKSFAQFGQPQTQVITPTEMPSSPPMDPRLELVMDQLDDDEELFEVELETAEGFTYKRQLTRRQLEELQAEEDRSPEGVDMVEPETENSEMDHAAEETTHSSVPGMHRSLTTPPPQSSLLLSSPKDVPLPLKDIPIIQGQETRRQPAKTPERDHSSRGKRISSLGNGFEGEPHVDVHAKNFYKHLEPGLPDPHKMRLLLTWSGKRAVVNHKTRMGKESAPKGLSSTDESTARNIVRVIMEDVIRDMKEGKVNTSWWNRPDKEGDSKANDARFTKPNAQNIANAEKLALFKKRLAAQQAEIKEWAKLEAGAKERATFAKDRDAKLIEGLQKPFSVAPSLPPLLSEVAISYSSFPRQIDQVEDAVDKMNSVNKRAARFCDRQFEALGNVLDSRQRKRPRQSQDFRTIFNATDRVTETLNSEQTRDVLRTLSRLA